MNLNFEKYKRVFAFGCSFTSYLWPTWADIIANECVNAKFYNLGRSASGNLTISCKIAEAQNIFHFNEDDLVMVLWSGYTREDRWFEGKWLVGGNVFSNDLYDDKFRKNFADPLGYLVRDLALIYNTQQMVKSLPCDFLEMFSYSVRAKLDEGLPINDTRTYIKFMKVYETFIKENINNTLFDYIKKHKDPNTIGYTFLHNWEKTASYDPHPNPATYLDFIKHLGINVGTKSETYVKECMDKLKSCSTQHEIMKTFPEHQDRIDESYVILM